MKCNACNAELNFPKEVLKQLVTCPYCNGPLKKSNHVEERSDFESFLKQMVADYGPEIFLCESVGKLRIEVKKNSLQKETAVLMELVFSDSFRLIFEDVESIDSDAKKTLTQKIVEVSKKTGLSEKEVMECFNKVCLIIGHPEVFGVEDINEEKQVKSPSKKQKTFDVPKNAMAFISRIESLDEVPGAARLDLAIVSGNEVVVRKGEFSVGDKVLYVRPNCRVKNTLNCFDFLKKKKYLVSKAVIMGAESNGVVVNADETPFYNYPLGADVTLSVVEPCVEDDSNSSEESQPMDNQDIRHWKEDKFYKNVYASKQFRNADSESKQEIRRMAKSEAKMIKQLRKDAGLDNGCYITTAICEEFGKPDDCYELTSLRNFRDGWLANQPDGMDLIKEYYATAPGIVNAVNAMKNRSDIYHYIKDHFLVKCLSFIEADQLNDCKETYIKMVNYLKNLVK